MNRRIEIDNFLKTFQKMFMQNPNLPITNDLFYHQLATYGLTKEEIIKAGNPDMRYNNSLFEEWEKHFQNTPHLHVYNDTRQTAFLQFRNTSDADAFKLYVSVPEEYLTDAVYKIFEFIAANNIKTGSKVANKLRSDVIVLRINNESDAKMVINYINSLDLFKKHSKPTNPFLLREGVVGMGYDKYLSFNSTVSALLSEYFEIKRKNNMLDTVCVDDFALFINDVKHYLSVSKEYMEKFTSNPDISRELIRLKGHSEKNEVIVNYIHIIDLIGTDLTGSLDYNTYFNKVNNYRNQNLNEVEEQKIQNILNNNSLDQTKPLSPTINPDQITNPRKLLNDYIIYAASKYGIPEVAGYLKGYMNGRSAYITRDNNFRILFERTLPAHVIQSITSNNLEDYIKNVCLIYGQSIFYKINIETANKYGEDHLRNALISGLNGDFKKFTNNGSERLREKLMYFLPPSEYYNMANEALQNLNNENQRRNVI